MQGLEGELDTIHAAFLHWGTDKAEDQAPGSFLFYHFSQRSKARFVSKDTEFGAAYGCYRPAEDDSYYWRTGLVLLPVLRHAGAGRAGPEVKMNAYVPMDDDHTLQWEIFVRTDGKQRPGGTNMPINRGAMPDVTQKLPLATWSTCRTAPAGTTASRSSRTRPTTTRSTARSRAAFASYSGIPGIRQQDMAVTEIDGHDLPAPPGAPGHVGLDDHPGAAPLD